MIRRFISALGLLCALTVAASAGCGSDNPNCIVPTAPPGTNNNQAASTAFVQNVFTGGGTPQAANTVFAGPPSVGPALPSFRALVGADLPNPGASAKGGVLSAAAAAHQFQTGINTSAAPTFAQPSFADISSTIATSQIGPTIETNVSSAVSGVRTVGPSDCNQTLTLTGGLYIVTLPASPLSNGFTADCTVTIFNNDTRAKILAGFPGSCSNNIANGTNGLLSPGLVETVTIKSSAWTTKICPNRWRPTSAVVLTVDNAGSDTTGDGLSTGGASSFQTITHCAFFVAFMLDYNPVTTQPTCGPTSGQTFTESVTWAVPPTGTNTLNIAGQGGAATWKPAGANPTALLVGNNANIQLANMNVSGTGTTCFSTNSCLLMVVHNMAVLETLAGVTCTDPGSTAGSGKCITTDTGTAGGGQINIDNGLTLAGTAIGTVMHVAEGTRLQFNGTLAVSGTPTINQIFTVLGQSLVCIQGNFATSGSFGAARKYVVLNNGILANVSGVAVPGSTAGCNTSSTCGGGTTFADGFVPNGGTAAGGC
jgi:hypothetical protein